MCAQTCLWACARGRCGSPCAVELVASKYLRKQASRERDPPSLLRSPVEGVARSLSCHTRARDGSGDKRHARARVWWYRVRPRKWDSTLIHLTVPTGVSAPHSAHASQPPLTCPERARTPKPGRAGAQGVPQHRGATRGGIKTGGATHKAARTALSRPARPLQQRHFFCTLVRKTAHILSHATNSESSLSTSLHGICSSAAAYVYVSQHNWPQPFSGSARTSGERGDAQPHVCGQNARTLVANVELCAQANARSLHVGFLQ